MTVTHSARRPTGATGLLAEFADADVLESADVHVAQRLGDLGGAPDEDVLLAAALAVRAVRHGSVCLDLAQAPSTVGVEDADEETLAKLRSLQWPQLDPWLERLAASNLVAAGTDDPGARPLRLVGSLLYLDRYWRQERIIATCVDDRRRRAAPPVDESRLGAALDRLFPPTGAAPSPGADPDLQRLAAEVAVRRWLTVLAGGPGTGKTTTVAKLLAALRDQPGPELRIALAAPTGKAAARLEEAVRDVVAGLPDDDRQRVGVLPATTIHRLLGWTPARTRFKHHRDNRLPYDVVVVDEASMVSLTLMSRLVESLRGDARLVLVGDPDQLASVEAGAVLGDLVQRPLPEGAPATGPDVVTLTRVHRHGGRIKALAEAVKAGAVDEVLTLLAEGGEVELVPAERLDGVRSDVVAAGLALSDAASEGDVGAALERLEQHRLLCAHRQGPYGVAHWSRQVEEWLREARPDYGRGGLWYVGRPLLVTSNDRDLGLYNGDTGVVMSLHGQAKAVFPKGLEFATNRLSEVTTVHAMSVHKSQGSQFERVTLVLPEAASPLLTKELFYTAVTRAKQHVRVVGSEEAVRAAVARRIQRASGLGS